MLPSNKTGIKPVILNYCPSPGRCGGIWTYIQTIVHSSLANKYYFDVKDISFTSHGIQPGYIFALSRQFKAIKPDILHHHGLGATAFHVAMAAKIARVPRILLTVHGFIEDHRYWKKHSKFIISHFLEPYTIHSADAVFCVSAYGSKKRIIKQYSRNNLGYINNGLSLEAPAPYDSALRAKYGLQDDDIVALCVSRLTPEKGLFVLLEALMRYPAAKSTKLKFLIVGDGEIRPALEAALEDNITKGQVVFAGNCNNIKELHAISDFFVLPTLHEHQSFAILEAMMAGKAVLTTNVGGNPELVEDGKTGLLIPSNDAQELYKAIQFLANNNDIRKRMGREGRRRLEQFFTAERMINHIETVYDRILEY